MSGVQWFEPAIKPPRIAIKKGDQYYLDFPSEEDRLEQLTVCKIKVSDNCQKGNRSTCALQAARHCKRNPILTFFNIQKRLTTEEKQSCEDDYMLDCVQEGKIKCAEYSEQFCESAFQRTDFSKQKSVN
eukprot:TRINITY_DN6710_c0_g2_i1.p2 TRINITY_DN6710_c0_g2~~TRINITY_DN6710_c0_g2_i1.p2  ORF type:complete len:142 (-),score=3.48 TRINITY_DN6710_c0_g2_i1:245-631(-)